MNVLRKPYVLTVDVRSMSSCISVNTSPAGVFKALLVFDHRYVCCVSDTVFI